MAFLACILFISVNSFFNTLPGTATTGNSWTFPGIDFGDCC